MVNFYLRLRDNMFAEWRHEYVDYARLKRLLRKQQQMDADLAAAASTALLLDIDTGTSSASDADYAVSSYDAYYQQQPQKPPPQQQRRRSRKHGGETAEMQSLVLAPVAFEDALEVEYDKVERAFNKHLTHFADQLALLRGQYRPNAPLATQESLKNSLVELHRLLNLLNNFALLNYTGFIKILKKHDKLFPSLPSLRREHSARLQSLAFAEARQCRDLLRDVEQMFADLFCDGNRSVALATLLTKREDAVNWSHMYIGIKIGSCLILLVWVVWDSLVVPTFRSERERHIIDLALTRAYPVYRGIGCVLLLHWLVGLSLYVWRKARINYRYIFELDPRNTQQYAEVFSDATNMTIVFLVNVLLYYKVVNGYFPEAILHRGYYPLALCVYTVYFYIIRTWSKQHGLRRTLVEIVCSPFYAVTFFHTFVGDYLTSVVKVNQDLCWSVCFFATREFLEKDAVPDGRLGARGSVFGVPGHMHGEEQQQSSGCQSNIYYVNVVVPLICALPLWWRFLQSLRRIYDMKAWWPNLPNAFKYALAQVVALFGIFHPFYGGDREHLETFQVTWIVLFTLSSMYTWVWDVTMDWGLGRPEYKFLGDRQMFSRKWVYYLAIAADLFLRFAWTLSLIPPHSSRTLPLYLQPFTMVAELFRRTFWSFFRLENEHLRNTQGFRRVDFIPLHYDHGVGDDDDDDDKRSELEPLAGRMFLMKILLILFVVLGLSIAAIVIEQ